MLNKIAGSTPVGAGRNAVISDMVRAIEKLQAGLPRQATRRHRRRRPRIHTSMIRGSSSARPTCLSSTTTPCGMKSKSVSAPK